MKVIAFAFFLFPTCGWAQLCVTEAKVALKAEPKNQAKVLQQLALHQPLKITKKSNTPDYYFVETMNKKRGYVLRSKTLFGRTCYQSNIANKYLRSSPQKKMSARLRSIKKGETFLQIGADDGWVELESSTGEKVWIEVGSLWQPTSQMRLSFEPSEVTGP